MSFVHLHTHTHYSLLDGANDIKRLVEKAVALKMPALSITDHGNMFGVLEFYKACKQAGIKPIIGMEAYMAPGSRKSRKKAGPGGSQAAYHLVLLAKNATGYRNLMKLSSKAYLEGFYYKPRIDKEILREHREGLIVLSACMKGEVFSALARDDREEAQRIVEEYLELFGEDYYLEIQNHFIPEEAGYDRVYKLAKEMGVPVVATNDVHYLEREHHTTHDILVCLQSGKTRSDPKRLRYNTEHLYLKSVDEMYELFRDRSEVLERTLEIAEKVDLEIEMGKPLLPHFPLPPEFSHLTLDDYLEKLAFEGARRIYGELTPEVESRLRHELKVIRDMGFAGYFLIVQDFVNYARQNDIPVGLGRGSAAGSLVAYALGITRVDPLKYGLLFERFLNPERISMPDIDIDFCFERRDEVIDYVRQRYGENNVAQIITFGTMASRNAIRDVARVLEIEYAEADRIAKLIPVSQGKPMGLEDAFKKVPELKALAESGDPRFQELIKHARLVEGLARNASVHAAGIIIAPDDITNYVPLHLSENQNKQKVVTTQFTMTGCEEIGLLKMDFLGLRTLTVIDKCVKMLERRGIHLDLDNLPMDDSETYEIFCEGHTVGVFQFESSGMREYLRKLRPNRIEDLIAMNALYRPGPMENIDTFIRRKYGQEPIEYLHPDLEPILKETYGIIVYQEQVMQIASRLAGFSLAKADNLRRAMGKKKVEVMRQMEGEFVEGCRKNGIEEKLAREIYQLMAKFAEYGFNKSHAAAYAILAYQTAYLKRHYPVEFMAATLTSEINNSSRIVVLIEECRRMGIEVLPPDVNTSMPEFTATEDGKIVFGLAAIKNVGMGAIRHIVEVRQEHGPFTNIFQFLQHMDLRSVNKKVLEALIQAGALDSLEGTRAQKFAAIEMAISFAQRFQEQEQNKSQMSLFDLMHAGEGEETHRDLLQYPELPAVPDWSLQEKLEREKTLLGFYVSGHPLDKYRRECELFATLDWENPQTYAEGQQVRAAVLVSNVKLHLDRKGKFMAFVTFEDRLNSFEGVVFSSVYERFGPFLQKGEVVFVIGKASDATENSFKLLVDEIIPMDQLPARFAGGVRIIIDTHKHNEQVLERVYQILRKYPGNVPVFFEVRTNGTGQGLLLRSKKVGVVLTQELLAEIQEVLGKAFLQVEHQ
ncbi:MAG: DNA polymerase III subunit alpha [Calditrichaeota bacterium]|nr:MAG: DNA polymerase III subunit alpha [Calditrichota bacterium]